MSKYAKYLNKMYGGANVVINIKITYDKVEYDKKSYVVDKDLIDINDEDNTIIRNDKLGFELLESFAFANNISIKNIDEYKFEWTNTDKLAIYLKKDYTVTINYYDTMTREITSTTTQIVHDFNLACNKLVKKNILTNYMMFNFANCKKNNKEIVITLHNNIVIDCIYNTQFVPMKYLYYYTLKLSFTDKLDRYTYLKGKNDDHHRMLDNSMTQHKHVNLEDIHSGDDDICDDDYDDVLSEYKEYEDNADFDAVNVDFYKQLNKKLNDENMANFFNKIYDANLLTKIFDKLLILTDLKNKFQIFKSKKISKKLGLIRLCNDVNQNQSRLITIYDKLGKIKKNNDIMKKKMDVIINSNANIKDINDNVRIYELLNVETVRHRFTNDCSKNFDCVNKLMNDVKTLFEIKYDLQNEIFEYGNLMINECIYEEIINGYNLIKLYIAIVNYLLETDQMSVYNKIIIDEYNDLVINMNSI